MNILDCFIINDKTKLLFPKLNFIRLFSGNLVIIKGLYLIIMVGIYDWPNYPIWGVSNLLFALVYISCVILMKHFDSQMSLKDKDILDHLIEDHRKN